MSSEGVPGYTHPRFAEHFTDPIYDDPADDFAPFGSDEGSDLFVEAEEQRTELGPTATVSDVLELTAAEDAAAFVDEIEEGSPDLDGFVIAAGFALLRLTGQIDAQGRQWLQDALDRTLRFYGDGYAAQHALLTRDLASFG
ncbi:hypothetical protein [Microlunatus antarcticus]|uniref:Uncharacterized protein YfeS n=1 Tax=Microlunatus antarcticus TaxID=53388 RepID=A0A7W5P644_9ACTN|nr:hypothetical protein [Microlunatus antarcticus]MBB3326135.1 uncharacterized protein YfeS [Microlunatus antarcticus]